MTTQFVKTKSSLIPPNLSHCAQAALFSCYRIYFGTLYGVFSMKGAFRRTILVITRPFMDDSCHQAVFLQYFWLSGISSAVAGLDLAKSVPNLRPPIKESKLGQDSVAELC